MDQTDRKSFISFFCYRNVDCFPRYFLPDLPKPWITDWFAQVNDKRPVKEKFGHVVETGLCRLPLKNKMLNLSVIFVFLEENHGRHFFVTPQKSKSKYGAQYTRILRIQVSLDTIEVNNISSRIKIIESIKKV